jgi:hypothetical protein
MSQDPQLHVTRATSLDIVPFCTAPVIDGSGIAKEMGIAFFAPPGETLSKMNPPITIDLAKATATKDGNNSECGLPTNKSIEAIAHLLRDETAPNKSCLGFFRSQLSQWVCSICQESLPLLASSSVVYQVESNQAAHLRCFTQPERRNEILLWDIPKRSNPMVIGVLVAFESTLHCFYMKAKE